MPKPNKYRKQPIGFEFTPISEREKVNYGDWVYRQEFETVLQITAQGTEQWVLATRCIEAIDAAEQSMPGHIFAVSDVDENGIHVTSITVTKQTQ